MTTEAYRTRPATEREKFDAIAELLHEAVGFRVRSKGSSVLMKIIAIFLYPFCPKFMTQFTTTIVRTVYFPDGYVEEQPGDAARTLAHEGQHLIDGEGNQPWFSISYLFPQCLALLALGAVGAIWWTPMLWCLLALGFLAPWPAPWRVHWERRGYLVTMICDAARGGQWDIEADWYQKYMAGHYSWPYYRMVWRLSKAREFCLADARLAKSILAGVGGSTYQRAIVAIVRDTAAT